MQKFIVVVLLVFTFSIVSKAQADLSIPDSLKTYKLSDVVITATKTFTPAIEVASSVTIITEKDLINSGKIYVSDILQDVAGVSVAQQGGAGKLTRVFIRGANPHHTLILIDGVEVNDPGSISNAFDLANLQTINIERIEILRGPQSTLYGSDALAGVISIFTKQGSGKPKFSVSAEGGSFETYKGFLGISGGLNYLKYSIGYSSLHSQGFSSSNKKYGNSENDSYQNNSFNSRIDLNPINNLELDFIFNYSKSKAGLDQNEKLGDDPNFFSNVDESLFKLNGTWNLFNGYWTQNFGVSIIKNINKTTDGIDATHPNLSSVNYFTGNRTKFEWQSNLNISRNNGLTLGFETEQEKAYSDYLSTSEWGEYKSVFPSNKATTTGVYLQDQLKVMDSFFSSFGIRYDKHNRFGSVLTYRIAPTYFLSTTNTKLKATYGTGFKSPSLYYLFDPMYGNPNLKPEKSKGWDAGVEQYLFNYNFTFGLTYFNNNFTDLIGYDKNFKTINIDKAETNGVEVSISTSAIYNFILSTNYTYTESKDKSLGNDDSGKDLLRRPKNKISFNINYSFSNANLNFEILNIGAREDKDFSTYPVQRVKLKSYTLLNVAVSYKFINQLSLYGRIENLTNTDYEEVLYYGTASRSAYLGLRINF